MVRVIVRIIIVLLLLAACLMAWWLGIMGPGNTSVEFSNIELYTWLNKLPLVDFDTAVETVNYRALHLEWLGVLAAWPLLLLFGFRSLTDFKLWQRIVSFIARVALLAVIVLALVDIERTEEQYNDLLHL